MKSTSLRSIFLAILLIFSHNVFADNVIADTAITTKVKSKIALDKSLSVFKANVNTSDGVVTLSGKVKSDTDAAALIEIAQSTEGVKDVNTANLKIKKSNQPVKDTAITAKIKGLYVREKLFGSKDINATGVHVETNNGVVYLSGNVDTQAQAVNAAKLAKLVKGVTKVESRVEVQNNQY